MQASSVRSFADVWVTGRPTASRIRREVALVVAGTFLLAICAQIGNPLVPVPATLQTFAVLLIGATLGAKRAAITTLAYLAEGSLGLPVFAASGAGLIKLFGPTAGYLWSFPIAAFVVGFLMERGCDRRFLTALLALLVGDVLILLAGFSWLATAVGPRAAWSTGVAPFMLFNALKIALVATALPIARLRISAR